LFLIKHAFVSFCRTYTFIGSAIRFVHANLPDFVFFTAVSTGSGSSTSKRLHSTLGDDDSTSWQGACSCPSLMHCLCNVFSLLSYCIAHQHFYACMVTAWNIVQSVCTLSLSIFAGEKLYGNSRPEFPGPYGRHQIEYYSEHNQFAHIGMVVDGKCVFKPFQACLGDGQVCPKHPEAVAVYEKGEAYIILYLRTLMRTFANATESENFGHDPQHTYAGPFVGMPSSDDKELQGLFYATSQRCQQLYAQKRSFLIQEWKNICRDNGIKCKQGEGSIDEYGIVCLCGVYIMAFPGSTVIPKSGIIFYPRFYTKKGSQDRQAIFWHPNDYNNIVRAVDQMYTLSQIWVEAHSFDGPIFPNHADQSKLHRRFTIIRAFPSTYKLVHTENTRRILCNVECQSIEWEAHLPNNLGEVLGMPQEQYLKTHEMHNDMIRRSCGKSPQVIASREVKDSTRNQSSHIDTAVSEAMKGTSVVMLGPVSPFMGVNNWEFAHDLIEALFHRATRTANEDQDVDDVCMEAVVTSAMLSECPIGSSAREGKLIPRSYKNLNAGQSCMFINSHVHAGTGVSLHDRCVSNRFHVVLYNTEQLQARKVQKPAGASKGAIEYPVTAAFVAPPVLSRLCEFSSGGDHFGLQ
jgi:hypothetical protein